MTTTALKKLTPQNVTLEDLQASPIELALTLVSDTQNEFDGDVILNIGTSTSVVRDFTVVLATGETLASYIGPERVQITCYHNHPLGTAASFEDQMQARDYQERTEGHGFIWGGSYITTPQGETFHIEEVC